MGLKKSNARKLVLGIMRNHLLNISTARTNMPGASKEYAPPNNKDRGKIYKVLWGNWSLWKIMRKCTDWENLYRKLYDRKS